MDCYNSVRHAMSNIPCKIFIVVWVALASRFFRWPTHENSIVKYYFFTPSTLFQICSNEGDRERDQLPIMPPHLHCVQHIFHRNEFIHSPKIHIHTRLRKDRTANPKRKVKSTHICLVKKSSKI